MLGPVTTILGTLMYYDGRNLSTSVQEERRRRFFKLNKRGIYGWYKKARRQDRDDNIHVMQLDEGKFSGNTYSCTFPTPQSTLYCALCPNFRIQSNLSYPGSVGPTGARMCENSHNFEYSTEETHR